MLNRNKIRQLLAFLIVLSGTALAVILFLKVRLGSRPAEPLPSLPRNVEMSLQNMHFTEVKDGEKKWDLFAERADRGGEVTRLSGVRLTVPGDKVTGDITLVSRQADYHEARRDVTLMGDVKATSTSGMKFTGDRATFDARRKVIRSTGNVRFSDRLIDVEGNEMEYYTETRDIKVSNNVVATVRPEAARK
jgi:LPS export ABC transporter protein LptC